MSTKDIIRRLRFSTGTHRYSLIVWATDRTDWRGCTRLGYRFTRTAPTREVLFEGEDFCGSPMHADDSDETMASLMGFLTLRPGDTDGEYFEGYSEAQLCYAHCEAESLQWAVMCRFGDR